MKKLLVVLLVMLGLQTQAQINICDSVTITGSQYQLTMEVSTFVLMNLPNGQIEHWVTGAPQGTCPNILNEDSSTNIHYVYNYNPNTGLPYDTLSTCITFMQTTCCIEWVWNGVNWQKVGMPSQMNVCDSLTYQISYQPSYPLGIYAFPNAASPNSYIDAVDFTWLICTMYPSTIGGGFCYSATGAVAFFGQITTDDTVKICYDAYVYSNNYQDTTFCQSCDTVIFDLWTNTWVPYTIINTPTSIQEINPTENIDDNRLYDMLGREIYAIPIGTPYIKNGKKYFKLKLNSK
jgi:hypothetical protein